MLTTSGVNRLACYWSTVLLLVVPVALADSYRPGSADVEATNSGWFAGLTSTDEAEDNNTVRNVHEYATGVAQALFDGISEKVKLRPLMVSSFVDVVSLKSEPTSRDPMALLGLQLEESFITLASEKGFHVKESRTRNSIAMLDDQTQVLSRNQAFLESELELGYFLTGTLTRQENGAMVNARLIDLSNNQVVSAAASFIPDSVFLQRQRSNWFNGRLYRNEYPVEESK